MKQIDFKPDRSLAPVSNLLTPEPDLRQLIRSKATDGPLVGAWIEAPYNWDGACSREGKPIPGRYKLDSNSGTWIWRAKTPETAQGSIG